MKLVDTRHFEAWSGRQGDNELHGLLSTITDHGPRDRPMLTHLYGFETNDLEERVEIPDLGATFGYVCSGAVTVWDSQSPAEGFILREGRWFALPGGCALHLAALSTVVVSQRAGWRGTRSFGGPIEELGRLRYIDGCSDTLLACPPLLGDPCLNHLHFPAGIEQTFHTHPSVRCGAVARGRGWCETPEGRYELQPGMVWKIPTGGEHRFLTTDSGLDVIAYHPDSDWGPTDTEHPMLNRTWVGGSKIDNTGEEHRAEVQRGS